MRLRRRLLFCACLVLIVSLPLAGVDAYHTNHRWMSDNFGGYANFADYQVDPNLDFY